MSKILRDIGKMLNDHRLKYKISHKKLAQELHLPKKHLISIEEGHLDDQLHPSNARRFLVLYINYLNLDLNQLLKDYDTFHEAGPKQLDKAEYNFRYSLFNKNIFINYFLW